MAYGERSSLYRTGFVLGVELSNLAAQAGFSGVKVYGSLEGIPYDHEANRLILFAVKWLRLKSSNWLTSRRS